MCVCARIHIDYKLLCQSMKCEEIGTSVRCRSMTIFAWYCSYSIKQSGKYNGNDLDQLNVGIRKTNTQHERNIGPEPSNTQQERQATTTTNNNSNWQRPSNKNKCSEVEKSVFSL